MRTTEHISAVLDDLCPNPKCALDFKDNFQCIVAVMLSAQTTDKSVNLVTPALFAKYKDAFALAKADKKDVENIIRSIGLYKNKANNIIKMSQALVERFGGTVPDDKKELLSLSGVGEKTANVVLAECFKIPAIAVDTHVGRVSKRLGLAKNSDEPLEIEKKLMRLFPKQRWIKTHHQFIYFGRNICHSQNPNCLNCPLRDECSYLKKTSKTVGK